jgi:tRNA pseudouridine13 synthase
MNRKESSSAPRCPYLTADIEGVGGVIKKYDDDFVVDEQPLYEPSGQGTHTYLRIEKRGLTTHAAIRQIAIALGKKTSDIGFAGLKDAHGVTRQTFSVEHIDVEALPSLALKNIAILAVCQHTNKLKLGHLAGNRFEIRIRDTTTKPLERAGQILEILKTRGLPNYFGPQRFGVRGDNATIGRAILLDDHRTAIELMLGRPSQYDNAQVRQARKLFDAGKLEESAKAWPARLAQSMHVCRALIKSNGDHRAAWHAVDHSLRKLYVSAVTSELFNDVLVARLSDLDRLQLGDVAWKHRNGACFLVTDAELEQPRCLDFEISPTGPIFGRKMKQAEGNPAMLESQVLEKSGLTADTVQAKDGRRLDGARRPLRVPIGSPTVDGGTDDRGPFLSIAFSLPPGAYATNVTREICKIEPA